MSSAGVPSSVLDSLVAQVLDAADGPLLVEAIRERAELLGRESLADPALRFSRVRVQNALERLLDRGEALRWRGATAETWRAPEPEKTPEEILADRVTITRDVLVAGMVVTYRVFLDRTPIGEFGSETWAEKFRRMVVEELVSG